MKENTLGKNILELRRYWAGCWEIGKASIQHLPIVIKSVCIRLIGE
jgi:hypothetical protein